MFDFNKRVFLDYASTTPTDRRVISAMKPHLDQKFANPSALHKEGLVAKRAVDNSREAVAKITQTKPTEIYFTGSGTEADNLALLGIIKAAKMRRSDEATKFIPHIITTNIEHPAVLEACAELEKNGCEITYLKVNEDGIVTAEQVKNALKENTVLVSIMLANNEIGTIFPVRDISREIVKYKKDLNRKTESYPYFHTDASQAPNYLDVELSRLGVDALTLDGSKIYGPKGVGCLVIKNHVPFKNILYGGKQERGIRPGTENVPGIVGFAKALEIVNSLKEKESERLKELQDYFIKELKQKLPKVKINGSLKNKLPNNINICFRDQGSGTRDQIDSEFLVIQLDERGIACSSASACKNLINDSGSYIVDALGQNCGNSSIRFSMGRRTTKRDIDWTISKLVEIFG